MSDNVQPPQKMEGENVVARVRDRLKKLLTPDDIVELELEKLHEEVGWSGDSNVECADRRATQSEEIQLVKILKVSWKVFQGKKQLYS
ncbi:hypothetical protein MP228_002915 [Amoeboaphelidium protococcarum]|nr:hypothetical protein MP228_002915 [Amoeboaphelidium protococcarum]